MKTIYQTLLWSLALLLLVACGPAPRIDVETSAPEAGAETHEETDTEIAEEETTAIEEETAPEASDETITVEITEAGTEIAPEIGDWVAVDLVGYLEDGTEFFNTADFNEPVIFPYGEERMVPGVEQAVGQMTVGSRANVTVPPALGFGEAGSGPVPPNATLRFEIEFLRILEIDIEMLEEGAGELPQRGDLVTVHYAGTLEDGTPFDSSYDRDQPFQFVLGTGGVIPGWDIGLAQMRVGSKARLTIPPELAYGSQDRPSIPGNSTLIFEVELLGINDQ